MNSSSTSSTRKGDKKVYLIILLVILLAAVFVVSLAFGSVSLSLRDLMKALFGADKTSTSAIVIRSIRLPRVIAGLFAGVGLSVAGVILQGVMNNALASPNTIGVGSGAGFFVMLSLVLFPA